MYGMLARTAHTRPKRVLGLTGIVVVIAVILGGPVAGLLTSNTDSFYDPDSESAQVLERIESATGVQAAPAVVVVLPAADAESVARAMEILSSDEDVAQAVGGPSSGEAFVSLDGTLTFVAAYLDADADMIEATARLSHELESIDGALVGGIGVLSEELTSQVEADLVRAEMFAFPILFVVSMWVFRSVVAALLPILVGACTIVLSLFVVRGFNEVILLSTFALNLITGLGLGLAIDYSLFIVSRYREELARRGPGREALQATVATAGRTVVFSAVTVAGAGVALLVFPLRFLYSMGIGVAVVALAAALVSIVVLPAVLALLGSRVNALAPRAWQRSREREATGEAHGFWYRWSTLVMRVPVITAIIGAVVMVTLGLPFLRVAFTGVDASILPASSSARQVATVLDEEFPEQSASMTVLVDAEERQQAGVHDISARINALDNVDFVTAATFLGDRTWRLDVAPRGELLDDSTRELVGDIRALEVELDVTVGGLTADLVDQMSSIGGAIPLALAILALLTFTALFLMTGSVVLPIKALIMNLLTISATFGILVWVFQDGHFAGLLNFEPQEGLESSQPVFLFAIAFGLSTDYAVFLLTRIKEARDSMPVPVSAANEREAVAVGLQRTGRIVTAAALLFAIAIGAFATSDIVNIKQIGIGVAVAVLIDAFVVRALLVPSLMALLGRWNWWSPKPLRRLHDRIGLSEG